MFFLLSFFPDSAVSAQSWEEFMPGFAKRTITVSLDKDKSRLEITLVRIEPKNWTIKVIDVFGTFSKRKEQVPSYSLRQIVSTLSPQVIINGGFAATYSLPIPAGLLVVDDKIIARLNAESSLQKGIFCVGNDKLKIVDRDDYSKERCRHAIQAGPVLVKSGKVAIFRREREKVPRYTRSAVCLDKEGKLILSKSSEAHLYDLAQWLAEEVSKGGAGCVEAMNLSGDAESALYINSTKSSDPLILGNIDVPISSAIAVFQK